HQQFLPSWLGIIPDATFLHKYSHFTFHFPLRCTNSLSYYKVYRIKMIKTNHRSIKTCVRNENCGNHCSTAASFNNSEIGEMKEMPEDNKRGCFNGKECLNGKK
uniref:Uncharacterized protein n=1 Tax=Echinococcus canadensis TaxID=519352 RepID=A0A915EZN4_9CEST